MPRFAYRKIILLSAPFLLLFFLTLPLLIIAAGDKGDSLSSEQENRGKHVNIRINEQGISIETDKGREGIGKQSSGATITIESTDREYKEKGNDVIRFGEDVFIDEDEVVMGDLVVFGGDVTVKGRVNGDVVVMGGDLKTLSGAEINGDAIVLGGRLEEDEDVTIQGERFVMRSFIPMFRFGNFFEPRIGVLKLILVPLRFLFCLLLSFLVLLFMRKRIEKSRTYLKFEYLKSFGWGVLVCFAAAFIIPIASIILAITIIGIPLAALIVLSWVGVCIIACAIFAYDLGIRVAEKMNLQFENPFALVLIGTAVLFLPLIVGYGIQLWPLIGWLGCLVRILANIFLFLACVIGLGALFSSRFGSQVQAPVIEPPPPGVSE